MSRDDSQTTPERIWLLLNEGDQGEHVWCTDPNPSGSGEHDAVEYIRADRVKELLNART